MTGKNATEVLLADAAAITRAAELLRAGGLVAVPTETVYGLAARADDADAIAAIYRAKGRPSFNPLIVHVADIEQARRLAEFSRDAESVAQAVWPGALTLVLPLRDNAPVAKAVTAGLSTIAIRCPAHPVMRALIAETGQPLAAPSANRSEAVSPTTAAHVMATLDGRVDLVLDGGRSEKGLESSILAIRHDAIWEELRPGPVDIAAIYRAVRGSEWERPTPSRRVEAPGQLARHYSPGKPIRLRATDARADEFHIGFGTVSGTRNLSDKGDLAEAASQIYAALHEASEASLLKIAIAPIPDIGIGKAINDRLRRAAA